MNYDFLNIEQKWQKKWEQDPFFAVNKNLGKPKYYCLDMFPYPSASGLHLGHWKGYVFSDVFSRIKYLQGFNVLHPMGWDAFGLPAENAAIKEGIHPRILTERNVQFFKKQLKQMGTMFDWEHELDTTDPKYYRWTQWIFLKMFEAGLAYEQEIPVNWCPKCLTGLANEEACGGSCDRCGTVVEQKPLRQWVLKITKYADELDADLDQLDWPEKVKLMQRNWIGKSFGVEIDFVAKQGTIKVYTTRPDTLFGCTFIALAPEHSMVEAFTQPERLAEVTAYVAQVKNMTTMERQLDKEKTGVFSGSFVKNPANGAEIPVYIASFVLNEYATGAVMCVPAHDQRDFEFATKFGIKIQQVVAPHQNRDNYFNAQNVLLGAITENGTLINSAQFNGLEALEQGKEKVTAWLESLGLATRKINYKLRDWVFSRQRYWGEPIPLVRCNSCGVVAVPEEDLPILLPQVEKYEPTGTGESPLAGIEDWVNTACPKCAGPAKRETNTMPQWAGSCWYFLRFADPHNHAAIFDPKIMQEWLPVDFYVGGIEHAVLHLLYSRFYVKFLHAQGYLPFNEPFKKLFNQGMICMKSEKSGRIEKMSKSKGNVVSPDTVIDQIGSDALRLYILFMGPPEMDCEWSENAVNGVYNFLGRLWGFLTDPKNLLAAGLKAELVTQKRFHRFLKEYNFRLELFKTNTAVASLMELLNDLVAMQAKLDAQLLQDLLACISVMVPHFASELLEKLLNQELKNVQWPQVDLGLAERTQIKIPVQVCGKMRAVLEVEVSAEKDAIIAMATEAVKKWLDDKRIEKIVFVDGKLVNFVVS